MVLSCTFSRHIFSCKSRQKFLKLQEFLITHCSPLVIRGHKSTSKEIKLFFLFCAIQDIFFPVFILLIRILTKTRLQSTRCCYHNSLYHCCTSICRMRTTQSCSNQSSLITAALSVSVVCSPADLDYRLQSPLVSEGDNKSLKGCRGGLRARGGSPLTAAATLPFDFGMLQNMWLPFV